MINSPTRSRSLRVLRRSHTVLILAILAGVFTAAVHAQAVQVTDPSVESNTSNTASNTNTIKSNTGDIKTNTSNISNQLGGSTSSGNTDNVNGHLKNIDSFDASPASALSAVGAPSVSIDTITPPSTDTSSCNGRSPTQIQNCKDIITTKNAQFTYMKAMYDMAVKRQTTLNNLQSTRHGLQPEQFGKLQDNTNQTLTLIAQMQIDRLQLVSVNNAYVARIEYLQDQQAQLAQSANAPGSNSPVSNIVSQVVSGAVLYGALSTMSANNATPLTIEGSNGW